MDKTPKSLRMHIGLFGRMNVGKSSFLNMIVGQDVSITSDVPGTTTDVVSKPMELLPIGPVVFHDTAGVDDASVLSAQRSQKTSLISDRVDIFVLIVEPDQWDDYEFAICDLARKKDVPLILVINKIDLKTPSDTFVQKMKRYATWVQEVSSRDFSRRDMFVSDFKQCLQKAYAAAHKPEPCLIGDLIPAGGIGILIVPIDLQAPKGRLILPQVQTIREALDNDAAIMVVKEREYPYFLQQLKAKPSIVICDSQVVLKMVADTPPDILCTTFSILFARYKGDLMELAKGAAVIEHLKSGDRILIAEGCSHHAIEDDIGRVKIPRWLKQYTGCDLQIDVCAGHDYPEDLAPYQLIILCGSCMLNRRETLHRITIARDKGVAITNYGLCISLTQGVLSRVLEPFEAAQALYKDAIQQRRGNDVHQRKC